MNRPIVERLHWTGRFTDPSAEAAFQTAHLADARTLGRWVIVSVLSVDLVLVGVELCSIGPTPTWAVAATLRVLIALASAVCYRRLARAATMSVASRLVGMWAAGVAAGNLSTMAWLPGDNHGAAAAFAVGVVLCYLLPVPAACRGGLGIGLSACYLSILIATDRPDAPVNILVDTAVGFGLANLVGAVVGRWVAAVRRRQFAVTHALERAADELQTFRGLLPICACCKSIRDDHGHWQRLEKYIQARTPATFTHGICPPCLASEYGVTPDGSKLPTLAGK